MFDHFLVSTAIEQAEALLKHAYMLQPENPHTLLTYIHTLEVSFQYKSLHMMRSTFIIQYEDICFESATLKIACNLHAHDRRMVA